MLILVGVTVRVTLGKNGLITKARKNSFYQEMIELDEKKKISNKYSLIENADEVFIGEDVEKEKLESLKEMFLAENLSIDDLKALDNTLKAEIIFVRNGLGEERELFTTEQIWNKNMYKCQDIFTNTTELIGMTEDIYYIKKEVTEKKDEKLYLYDRISDLCFKIEQTKIAGEIIHSLPYAKFIIDREDVKGIGIADFVAEAKPASDGTLAYEPDLNNFSYSTQIVYYSPDFKDKHYITLKQFIELDCPSTMKVGEKTYKFADYTSTGTKVWANIKTTANGLESWWVWIPRYAYKLDSTNQKTDIIFIDTDNNPLDKEKYGAELSSEYTVHEGFKQKDGLKGIWFSKYDPTAVETVPTDKTEPTAPDLSNFDTSNLKIVYYTASGTNPILKDYTENPAQTIEEGGQTYYWYNYTNKIWANIKTTANGLDSWWVWIPRYAYKLESGTTSIILVDENDIPIDTEKYGNKIPEGYTLHEGFNQKDGLKGIWFSKYDPTPVQTIPVDKTEPESPNLTNFETKYLTIVYYKENGTGPIEIEYSAEDLQNNLKDGKIPQTIEIDGTTYYWYNYSNKIWANVKTTNEGLNSYWVWIPRYAYKLESGTTSIILVDKDNKPLDKEKYGDALPEGFTLHEGFNQKDGLMGIWFSKYDPTPVSDETATQ